MPIICPTVTAFDIYEYHEQINVIASFAERVHIDLMDGEFAPTLSPPITQIDWPPNLTADIHLMYEHPMDHLEHLITLKPHLVIIHQEALADHQEFCRKLQQYGIKTGLALLHDTSVESAKKSILLFDHILIFSGDLGKHGGIADISLLSKVAEIRAVNPNIEISWDGGIDDTNALKLLDGGIDVLNVGGYIKNAQIPSEAYAKLKAIS